MIRKLLPDKTEASIGGHADLFWSIPIWCGLPSKLAPSPKECPKVNECTVKPKHCITFVRWQGYNDANWWVNVAPTEQARVRKMPCGRMFEIDFKTCEVFELIQPDFTGVTVKELADELERRVVPDQPEYASGSVKVHSFHRGEEGVIVKYIPVGEMGLEKKPETQQWGIYNSRILVVNDE
jgi:hypothetical protein